MLEDETETCSFNVCSKCEQCCCQDAKPPLTTQRKKKILAYLTQEKIPVGKPFTREEYFFPSVDAQLYCVFYNKANGKCLIHAVKPETCVAGPLTFDINLQTGKVEWYLKRGEICALAQKLYENSDLLKSHLEAAKKQIMALITKLDSAALQAILKIPEPQTFKIGEDDLPSEAKKKLGLT